MNIEIAFLISLISVATSSSRTENEDIEGYYWRDYKGFIPEDAFPGGRETNNRKTYIGQILYKELLIPGEIRESSKRAYYEWGFQELIATENVKILCTRQPERFQWVSTTKDDFKMLNNQNFVIGGYEVNNEIYVGRKVFDKSIIVGKVQVELPERPAVFHYPKDKVGHFDYVFEVLKFSKPRYITISVYL